MRIAQVHYQFPAEGGQERHVFNISKRLVRKGHSVTVCTSNFFDSDQQTLERREVIAGIDVARLSGVFTKIPPRRIIIPKMLEFLINSRFDIIHAHSMLSQPTEAALWAARDKKIPFVYTPHFHPWQSYQENPRERRLRRSYEGTFFQTLLNGADLILAVSNFEKKYYIEKFNISKEKIQVIPNAISLNDMRIKDGYRSKVYHRYDLDPNKKYVLFLGLLTQRKGPLQALKAFNIVKNYVKNTDMIIAGRKRDQYKKIERYIERNDLKNRVKVIGYVSDRCRNVLLERADVLLVPSNYEAFGMIFIESLFHKTPVVSTQVGGIPFAVRNRVDGFLVQNNKKIQALAKYTIRLLKNNELREKMGRMGKERVEKKFLWEKSVEQLEKAYKKLINHKLSKK